LIEVRGSRVAHRLVYLAIGTRSALRGARWRVFRESAPQALSSAPTSPSGVNV